MFQILGFGPPHTFPLAIVGGTNLTALPARLRLSSMRAVPTFLRQTVGVVRGKMAGRRIFPVGLILLSLRLNQFGIDDDADLIPDRACRSIDAKISAINLG